MSRTEFHIQRQALQNAASSKLDQISELRAPTTPVVVAARRKIGEEVMALGAKGTDVVEVQNLLNSKGNSKDTVPVTGVFDSATENALKKFQQSHNRTPIGTVDAATAKALDVSKTPTAAEQEKAIALSPWMKEAFSWNGVAERPGESQDNPEIIGFHSTAKPQPAVVHDERAWCSAFANSVMEESGYKGTGSVTASTWQKWGKGVLDPQAGDIVVVKKNNTGPLSGFHVGFFMSYTMDRKTDRATGVTIYGGNQSNRVGSEEFKLDRFSVMAVRRPNSALNE